MARFMVSVHIFHQSVVVYKQPKKHTKPTISALSLADVYFVNSRVSYVLWRARQNTLSYQYGKIASQRV